MPEKCCNSFYEKWEMVRPSPVFVVIARLSVCSSFCRRPPKEPSFGTKMPFGGRVVHPKTGRGSAFLFFPKWVPGVFNQTSAFMDTFGWGKAGGNPPHFGRNVFRKFQPPIPEHRPAHTPSGLRAGNPALRKSSPRHLRASASPFPRRWRTPWADGYPSFLPVPFGSFPAGQASL